MSAMFGREEAGKILAKCREAARNHLGLPGFRMPAVVLLENGRAAEPTAYTHGLPVHRAPLGDHVLRTWDGVWYDLNFRQETAR